MSHIKTKQQKEQENCYEFPYHYVSKFRDNFQQFYNDTWGMNYAATIEFILNKLKNEKFEKILDVGCGDGRLVYELSNEFNDKYVHGIDYSNKAINLAKAMNPKGNYSRVDITNHISIENNDYDVVTLIEVFEHIPPEEANHFLYGIKKSLKPEGILLLTVPHKNKPLEEHHFRHFNSLEIENALSELFEIDEIIFLEKMGLMMHLIKVLLSNRLFILQHQRTLNYLYSYFKDNILITPDENNCGRIFIRAILKK